jgi:hypothetical protein
MGTAPVEVDDPYERGAKVAVLRRTSDFINREHAAGRLDDAQREAAKEFERLREITMSSGLSSPSFAREYVDSSGRGDPITDRVILAFKRLQKARQVLGVWAYGAIDQCVCEGLTPTAIQEQSGQDRKITAAYIKDGLEILAIYWGYATDPASVRRRASIERIVGSDFELVVNVVEG